MTIDGDFGEMVQLATRIPKILHERVRRFCIEHDMLVQDFVTDAIAEGMQIDSPATSSRGGQAGRAPSRTPSTRLGRSIIDWRQQFGHIAGVPASGGACPLCGQPSSIADGELTAAACEHDVGWLVHDDAGTPTS